MRQHEAVEDLPMGYQAQADFGQIWLKTDKGNRIKLYCFTMVLSHSRYKFALWMDRPFTTVDFTRAHDMAFKHLGGMPIEIVYDQDRLLDMDWIDDIFNLIFLGPPGVGKTHISVTLGYKAIEMGYRVTYTTMDHLMYALKTSDISRKSKSKVNKIHSSELVIIDEV